MGFLVKLFVVGLVAAVGWPHLHLWLRPYFGSWTNIATVFVLLGLGVVVTLLDEIRFRRY